jgi:hypothetical protein
VSDEIFPELPGLQWEATKKPVFHTKIMQSVNGRELRASYQAVPTYEIGLSFDFLREWQDKQELQQLESFFIERRGAFDSFLYKFPEDHDYQCEFVGDGLTTVFQLYKQMGKQKIPITNVEAFGSKLMWNENHPVFMWSTGNSELMWTKDYYDVQNNGLVIFDSPPAIGQIIYIEGMFYYRCRFAEDEQEYTHFMHKLWKAKQVDLIGSLGNKI